METPERQKIAFTSPEKLNFLSICGKEYELLMEESWYGEIRLVIKDRLVVESHRDVRKHYPGKKSE